MDLVFVAFLATAIIGGLTWILRKKNQQISLLIESQHQLEKDKVLLESQLEASQNSNENEKKLLSHFQSQLESHIRGMAAQALEGNAKQFLELANSQFQKHALQSSSSLDKKETSIQNMVDPLSKALSELNKKNQQIEKEHSALFAALDQEIKRVVETNSVLAKETMALKDALKKPHVRGRWGEVQLKNCIELAGMSEYSDVSFQSSVMEDEQRLIPDMVVRMPGGRQVVVDAKTPLDAFISALEANDESEKVTQIARHGRHVKDHVKKLSTKDYASVVEGSADFTVMFLPNESFLYSALESEPDLMEFALQRKILIATPPTLIGLLKVISYGWNEEKLAQNAAEISKIGIELHKRVCDFVDTYESVGKHIGKALSEYEAGKTRLNSRVLVQAKKLEKLGAKSKKDLPELPEAEI